MKIDVLINSFLLLLIPLIFVTGCVPENTAAPASVDQLQFTLVKKVEITSDKEGGSARPEMVAIGSRAYALYLGNIQRPGNRIFGLKIFNRDLEQVISSKTLVTTTDYGGPTDIRITADNNYLYAFYETFNDSRQQTHLWGAKYKLDDNFTRAGFTVDPIAVSGPLAGLEEGGELLDDPCPLLGPNSVFVITRLKYSVNSYGKTVYRVRELNLALDKQLRQFDLDLTGKVQGRGRVSSMAFHEGIIYFALSTTTSGHAVVDNDDAVESDILLVKLKPDWTVSSVSTISAEPDDRETYISGFKTSGKAFFMAYRRMLGSPPQGEQRSQIKVFDMNFNLLHTEVVKTSVWGPSGGETRPSLEVSGDMVFSGQSGGKGLGKGNAEIYIYRVKQ